MNFVKLFALVFCLAVLSACSQPKSLSGKYQLENRQMGIEFLPDNNAILRGGEMNDIAIKYEILQGSDGLNLKIIGGPLDSQVFELEQNRNSIILTMKGEANTFLKVDEFSLETPQLRAKQSEAMTYVGSMNRAQQAFYLEKSDFASSLAELEFGMLAETPNYSYRVERVSSDAVMNVAVAKDPDAKSYIGLVYRATETTKTRICETSQPLNSLPAFPPIPSNASQDIQCPSGTSAAFYN